MIEFFTDVVNIVTKHYPFLLRGVGYTMLIAIVGTLAGLLIGLAFILGLGLIVLLFLLGAKLQ